jgi:hypothetical protein
VKGLLTYPPEIAPIGRVVGLSDQGPTSVRESRIEKQLEDRLMWVVLVCGMPFIYFAIVHPSLQTLVLFQGYLLTATAVGVIGIKNRAVLRQKWFWRAMACSLPVHTAAIAGIYYWDKANLEIAFKGFYTVGIVWLVCVVEMFVILAIMVFWEC